MIDPMENGLFDIPDYENTEDETFPPLPPPLSPGQADGEEDPLANGHEETSELAEAPVAKRRVVKRPQPKLDAQRLVSEKGLPALRTMFDDVRFKGKGHEADDLRVVMQKMENWAHRLYPKLQFEEFVDKLESLGSKKEVQTCLRRIRLDMPLLHEDFVDQNGEEGTSRDVEMVDEPDPFSEPGLTGNSLVHSTPAAGQLTEEQRHRIELNKRLALERRLARQQERLDSSHLADEEPSATSGTSQTQDSEDPLARCHGEDGGAHFSASPGDWRHNGVTGSPEMTNGRDDSD